MFKPLHAITRFASSPKGAKITLVCWLLLVVILAGVAPGAKQYSISAGEGGIGNDKPAEVAKQLLDERFPSKDGLTALLVFHADQPITPEQTAKIAELSEWLVSADKPQHVANALPFHQLPPPVQEQLFSEDHTTLLLSAALEKDIDSSASFDTLKQIREHFDTAAISGVTLDITGPAGISADTISLFKNADFVLMLATVVLILIILIAIYRSPLLAIIPLAIAAFVYEAVDKLLGLGAKAGWLTIDKQALSIMMILLFAVLTDYCLFIFSRYREELRHTESKYEAMQKAMLHVAEPILFSGGTVLMAVLLLFLAVFKPYHYFAPVFSVTLVVILIAGLTLIPALFALVGRKAFWPFVPKQQETTAAAASSNPAGMWEKIGAFVTRKPGVTAVLLLIPLIAGAVNISTMKFSFNLLKSFPENISSRQGFEVLEQKFPKGQLAPITVVLDLKNEATPDAELMKKLAALTDSFKKLSDVNSVKPDITADADPAVLVKSGALSEQKNAIKLQLVLKDNPYDTAALDFMQKLRGDAKQMLQDSGFDTANATLHYAGQTAEQLDVRGMNAKDTVILFSLIALAITVMLAFQTRSVTLPIYMILTILLSYAATIGLGWFVFHSILGYEGISYRIPVYTFVFLVALGVDYNIMLVSRIREEASKHPWRTAVSRGVALTGGVISSAGLILAATFGVLITQPLQELFLFGVMMAAGVLIDTFLVRGMLLPAILVLVHKDDRDAVQHQGNRKSKAAQG